MTSLAWHRRAKTAGEIALLSQALYDAGFRVPPVRQYAFQRVP